MFQVMITHIIDTGFDDEHDQTTLVVIELLIHDDEVEVDGVVKHDEMVEVD